MLESLLVDLFLLPFCYLVSLLLISSPFFFHSLPLLPFTPSPPPSPSTDCVSSSPQIVAWLVPLVLIIALLALGIIILIVIKLILVYLVSAVASIFLTLDLIQVQYNLLHLACTHCVGEWCKSWLDSDCFG